MKKTTKDSVVNILSCLALEVFSLLFMWKYITGTDGITKIALPFLLAVSAALAIYRILVSAKNEMPLILLVCALILLSGLKPEIMAGVLLVYVSRGCLSTPFRFADAVLKTAAFLFFVLQKTVPADAEALGIIYTLTVLEWFTVLPGIPGLAVLPAGILLGLVLAYTKVLWVPVLVLAAYFAYRFLKGNLRVPVQIVWIHLFGAVHLLCWLIRGEHSPVFLRFAGVSPVCGWIAAGILAVLSRYAFAVLFRNNDSRMTAVWTALVAAMPFFEILSVPAIHIFTVLWAFFPSGPDADRNTVEYYREHNTRIRLDLQKSLQTDVLKDIRKVCEKNGITYFLGGGTLLGAIRHKGYIPWDDDVDIMLPRKDYERFAEVYNRECDPSFRYIEYRNTYGYYYSFGKVVDTRTRMFEFKFKDVEEMGIYIDVFPIEKMPDDDASVQRMFRDYRKINRFIYVYQLADVNGKTSNPVKKILRKIAAWILEYFDLYYWLQIVLEKTIRRYDRKDVHQVACLTGIYKERELMPASYMEKTVMVPFEGEEYAAPAGYHDYLTKHYGDYMQLPPEENRVSRHDNQVYWRSGHE